jgi:putative transposase
MPNYRRATVSGATYFFTVTTHHHQKFLLDSDVRAALRAAIGRVREIMPFTIDAWVLLPDHMHCIWTLPVDDDDYSTRWRIIKTVVTQRCGERLTNDRFQTSRRKVKHQSTLWQHRFWEHMIRDERDFNNHVDYLHFNPVKHGYVQQTKEWPYSSFHRYVSTGMLTEDWGCSDIEGKFGEVA